jgi:hypothetical protein
MAAEQQKLVIGECRNRASFVEYAEWDGKKLAESWAMTI